MRVLKLYSGSSPLLNAMLCGGDVAVPELDPMERDEPNFELKRLIEEGDNFGRRGRHVSNLTWQPEDSDAFSHVGNW